MSRPEIAAANTLRSGARPAQTRRQLHRSPNGVRRPRRLIESIVIGGFMLVVLLVGGLFSILQDYLENRVDAPIEVAVKMGETAELRAMDVTITEIAGAPTIDAGFGFTDLIVSPGLWVKIDLGYTPNWYPNRPYQILLRTPEGVTYSSRSRVLDPCQTPNPGISNECAVAIEIPPEVLPGSVIIVEPEIDNTGDNIAVIDPQITRAKVEVWQAASEPLSLQDSAKGGY